MRVKVHPHKSRVNAGIEDAVSITPDHPGGHAYYMGTVKMSGAWFRIHNSGLERARREQVRNVHAWVVGDLVFEHPRRSQVDPDLLAGLVQVTYHFNMGRFMTLDETDPVDVTDGHFTTAVISGRDFYVSPDWR